MEQHIEYFNFAANLARAEAIALAPDATAGIDRYNDECARRGDILDAARATDIADLMASFVESDDPAIARELVDWMIDRLAEESPKAIIAAALKDDGLFGCALREASARMANERWETTYGRLT